MFLNSRQGIWLATTGPSRKLWWLGERINGPVLGRFSFPLTRRLKKSRMKRARNFPKTNQRKRNARLLLSARRTSGSSGSTASTESHPGRDARDEAEEESPRDWSTASTSSLTV